MENWMYKNLRKWQSWVILIAVALLAVLWTASTLSPQQFQWKQRTSPQNVPGDIEFFYMAQSVVSTIDVILLVFLTATYASICKNTRSKFTFGLLAFSFIFLIRDIMSNPFVMLTLGFQASGLGPLALLPDLLEFAALSVLLYLTVKY